MNLMQKQRGMEPLCLHPGEAHLWGPFVAVVCGVGGGLPAAVGWLLGVSLLKTPPVGSPAVESACGPFPGPGPWWQLALVLLDYQKVVDVGRHMQRHLLIPKSTYQAPGLHRVLDYRDE